MARKTDSVAPVYDSFLLRLWRESERSIWRASLESATTGERHGFPNLASLFAFLQAKYPEEAIPPRKTPAELQE